MTKQTGGNANVGRVVDRDARRSAISKQVRINRLAQTFARARNNTVIDSIVHVRRPSHHRRHPKLALPIGVLFTAERGHRCVRPRIHVWSVIGRVDDDRVVGDAEIIEYFQQFADVAVMLDHAVSVFVVRHAALPAHRRAHMRVQMHARRVHPHEERFPLLHLPLDESDRRTCGLVVDRLHAPFGERAGVFDFLFANFPKARVDGLIVGVGGRAFQYAARAEPRAKGRVLRSGSPVGSRSRSI